MGNSAIQYTHVHISRIHTQHTIHFLTNTALQLNRHRLRYTQHCNCLIRTIDVRPQPISSHRIGQDDSPTIPSSSRTTRHRQLMLRRIFLLRLVHHLCYLDEVSPCQRREWSVLKSNRLWRWFLSSKRTFVGTDRFYISAISETT